MKKIILSFAIALSSYCSYAQVYDTGNYVGVGTPSPSEKLEVNGNLKISGVLLPKTTESNSVALSSMSDIYANYFFMSPGNYFGWRQSTIHTLSLDSYNTGVNKNLLSITQDGFLGIGYAADPASGNSFAVNGKSYFGNNTSIVQSGNITPGVGSTYGLRVYNGGSEQATIGYDASYVYLQSWSNKPLQINNQGNNTIINPTWGNVGIGTTSPGQSLTVFNTSNTGTAQFRLGYDNNYYWEMGRSATTGRFGVFNKQNNTPSELLSILTSGFVGIGTTQPDQKLTVVGTIHSSEVKVDNNMPPPDYVFEKTYKPIDLTTLKVYLDQNHHLPEIPSAAEIIKNGLNLGEMNLKLLKKVEELTLYIIDKDKQLAEQNIKISDQEQSIKSQQAQIDELKEQLKVILKSLPQN